MENMVGEYDENKNQQIKDEDLFIKIWTSPRQVFKYLNDNQYDKYTTLLLTLAGFSDGFQVALTTVEDTSISLVSLAETIILYAILGGLFGWVSYYFYAALIVWTGKLMNGAGEIKSVLRVLSYAMLPNLVILAFTILQIIIDGVTLFGESRGISYEIWSIKIFVFVSVTLTYIFLIWVLILSIIGISEVQKISIPKAILNLIVSYVVIAIPILFFRLVIRAI